MSNEITLRLKMFLKHLILMPFMVIFMLIIIVIILLLPLISLVNPNWVRE